MKTAQTTLVSKLPKEIQEQAKAKKLKRPEIKRLARNWKKPMNKQIAELESNLSIQLARNNETGAKYFDVKEFCEEMEREYPSSVVTIFIDMVNEIMKEQEEQMKKAIDKVQEDAQAKDKKKSLPENK